MDQSNHHSYYRTRAKVSRELAQRAVSPGIAAIHSELATRYEKMIAQLEQDGAGRDAQFA